MKLLNEIHNGERCPVCGHTRLYTLADGRLKCAACYHKYSLNMVKKDIEVLRYFAAAYSANEAAERGGMNYRTVANRFWKFRAGIASYIRDRYLGEQGESFPDIFVAQTYPGDKAAFTDEGKSAVLAFMTSGGNLYTGILPDADPAETFREIRDYCSSCLVFHAAPFRSYQSFKLVHRYPGSAGQTATVPEKFWEYLREELGKYRGTSLRYFPLYLKELELRYVHRDEEFFPLAARVHYQLDRLERGP